MKRALAFFCCLLGGSALADESPPQVLSFRGYLHQVQTSNLDLLAQRYSVDIARAQVMAAKVFPDPVLSGGISQVDVSGQAAPLMSTLGLTLPLELGGKRSARVDVAQREVSVAEAELDDALRKLRAEAAQAFVDALAARRVLLRKQQTLQSLQRLVAVNEKRVQTGDIGEVALMQSRVESQHYRAEVVAAEGELRALEQSLRQYLGRAAPPREQAPQITGELSLPPREFTLDALIEHASRERPDVRARRMAMAASAARLRLAQRNRWIDVSLNVSWQRSLYSEPFASPQYDALSAILSLPLPFSRVYRGEVAAAEGGAAQSQLGHQAAALRAEVEVQQALTRYQASVQQLAVYNTGLLADAERVHAATLYSYQRGSATLLEVLNAQRTVDDVHLSYTAALAAHAHQLIAVEQAAGIWDIEF